MPADRGAPLVAFSFESADTSRSYAWVPNDHQRVTRFSPALQSRGDATGRMQAHGSNPRPRAYGGLILTVEGRVLGPDDVNLVAERRAMLAALFGDLTGSIASDDVSTGRFTFEWAGDAEAQYVDGTVDAYTADLGIDTIAVAAWQLTIRSDDPCFFGADSGDPIIP